MNAIAEFRTINDLDLDSIREALMDKESGEGWSLQKANAVELEYRRFLCLMKLFPDEQVAPLVDVDVFWHCHILDTMKYAADCARIFGYFLHHVPSRGVRDEDDQAAHDRMSARMQQVYEATFGEAYFRPDANDAMNPAWCQPGTVKAAAWCQPGTPKNTAWCQPGTQKTAAWCQPGTTKAAAWCQPGTTNAAAWCQPSTTKPGRPWAAASNDQFFARAVSAVAA